MDQEQKNENQKIEESPINKNPPAGQSAMGQQPSPVLGDSLVTTQEKKIKFKSVRSSKTFFLVLIVVIIVILAFGLFDYYRQQTSHTITKPIAGNLTLHSPTNSSTKSQPSAVTPAVVLPEVYSPSSGFSLATETYSPPASTVGFNWFEPQAYADPLVTSRVLAYAHQTGIYTGLLDSQIDLYDTTTQKNYVLVPGGTNSAAIANNSPILLANNKMLFVQTTGSASSEVSKLMLMNLVSGQIAKVTLPFSDITTLDSAAVAPNGLYVAYPMDNAILVLNTQTGQTTTYPVTMVGSLFSGSTQYEQMAWSSDSSTIYYANQYFIVHNGSQGTAAFQANNIYALNLASDKSTQLTNDSAGNDTLQVYGSRLYFKQYSSIDTSTEAYIDLSAASPTVTLIPNSNNFVWPILPTADGTEFIAVPSDNTTINLMNFQGQIVQSIYANMLSSGKLLNKQYIQALVIGWVNPQTLMVDLHGLHDDVYTYNIQTQAVSVVLNSAL